MPCTATAFRKCAYTGAESIAAADSVVLITARVPNDGLYQQLLARTDDWSDAGVRSVRTAGDADARSTIAAAVCWVAVPIPGLGGTNWHAQFDRAIDDPALAIRREVTELSADYP